MFHPQLRGKRTGPEALDQPRAICGGVGWIGQDQIERRLRTFGAAHPVDAIDPGDGIAPHHLRSIRHIQRLDIALQQRRHPTIRLDKMDVRRASRQRFDSQGPGTGVEIGDERTLNLAPERGEPRLPDALRRGTRAPSPGGVDEAAAQIS